MFERDPLQRLHAAATVWLDAGQFLGSGLAVAPGHVLTCAHVVRAASENSELSVISGGQRIPATLRAILPKEAEGPGGQVRLEPDVAWLQIDGDVDAYARLDPTAPRVGPPPDKLWIAGYTNNFDGQPGLSFGTYDVLGQRESTDGYDCTWELGNGQVTYGMSGAGLLNYSSGLILGLMTTSKGLQSDLGGWAVAAHPLLGLRDWQELLAIHNDHHEQDGSWDAARLAAGLQQTASPSLVVGWATEKEELAAGIKRAVEAFGESIAPGSFSQLRYGGESRASRLHSFAVGSEADLIVAKSTCLFVATDDLMDSPACHELIQAAARTGKMITVLSYEATSPRIVLPLQELSDLDLNFVVVDLEDFELQAAIGLLMLNQVGRPASRGIRGTS